MTLLQEALDAPWCVISVMGPHAGEGVEVIFDRKAADCQTAGQTFWVAKSAKARPGQVQVRISAIVNSRFGIVNARFGIVNGA